MEMTPLWKSAQDADSHSGLEKPRQERSAFPHFHRPDDEIKSTEKNFRKYFCRTSRTELIRKNVLNPMCLVSMLGEYVYAAFAFHKPDLDFAWKSGLATSRCQVKELFVVILLHLTIA